MASKRSASVASDDVQRLTVALREALPRTIFRVSYSRAAGAWVVTIGGSIVCAAKIKTASVDDAVIMARALHREHGIRAQVVIYALNGPIQSERTYPDETPRRKG